MASDKDRDGLRRQESNWGRQDGMLSREERVSRGVFLPSILPCVSTVPDGSAYRSYALLVRTGRLGGLLDMLLLESRTACIAR